MAFDVSALSEYTDEHKLELISKTLFGGRTGQDMNRQTGIKHKATINIGETDAVFQTGGCGFNSSGTTTFSQREIAVGNIKVQEALCPEDFNDKYLAAQLAPGFNKDIPMAVWYMERKSAQIAKALELAYWQGEVGGAGGANLTKFDGFLEAIKDAGTSINGNPTGITVATGITSSNVAGIFDGIYELIPEDLLDPADGQSSESKVIVATGWDVFRKYALAIKNSNFFHYAPDGKSEILIPGTNVKVKAYSGLSGLNRIEAFDPMNMVIGVDKPWEEDEFDLSWADEAREVRFNSAFKVGTNIAFPDQVVDFQLV